MGIGGHILGERKLRRLRERTGLNIDRAYRRNHECEARVIYPNAGCVHFRIDYDTGEFTIILQADHWWSCPKEAE